MEQSLVKKYNELESVIVKDRHGKIISVLPNAKGEYSLYKEKLPDRLKEFLTAKEDRFFYVHPGVNPASIARSAINRLFGENSGGGSTITEQLAKNLLGHENERTLGRKIAELFYAFSLEIFLSKEKILAMYANTVYLGNNIQGFGEASLEYFGKNLEDLNDSELISLIASLPNPSAKNPWKNANKKSAETLAALLSAEFDPGIKAVRSAKNLVRKSETAFELESLKENCEKTCVTTLDKDLTSRLREILRRNIGIAWDSRARNGAIVVLKLPENELLAIVGSPNPGGIANGQSINMAIEPRPIGSTAKPFIYLKAFEKGLRPYTLAEDREYKYPIATGYPLYPKNYDGLYHGEVTLHEALSNSYNTPAVKVLEYVGLSEFYDFLLRDLSFAPAQDLDNYRLGIALGGLEMDPLTLAHYLSLFPAGGTLKPLYLYLDKNGEEKIVLPPMALSSKERKIADPKYAELVTKILSDRKAGVSQFGLESSLNLTQDNYAVKTGTSRDYHDSWTVGYTPDYLAVVWLGNAENEPLKKVTGQSGAGRIWNETMELLGNSEYNRKTPFAWKEIKAFLMDGSISFGLRDDIPEEHINLMKEGGLILSPHAEDMILFEEPVSIPLKSSEEASWYAEDSYIGKGKTAVWHPEKPGIYKIKAVSENKTEIISVQIAKEK